jgi:hypothetical protein
MKTGQPLNEIAYTRGLDQLGRAFQHDWRWVKRCRGRAKFGLRTPNEPRKLLRHVDDLDLSKLFQPFPTQFGADT